MKIEYMVLAAGNGKRMKSNTSKPLVKICGRPMIKYILDAIGKTDITIVTGKDYENFNEILKNVTHKIQLNKLGTADCVKSGLNLENAEQNSITVVLPSDMPLIKSEDLNSTINSHIVNKNLVTLMTGKKSNPFGYGRILKNNGNVIKIVEELDCTSEEKLITEINSGIYVFDTKTLVENIIKIRPNNNQKEYYLTDIIEIISKNNGKIGAFEIEEFAIMGVNDQYELSIVERIMYKNICMKHQKLGIYVLDPNSVYIDYDVKIEPGSCIYQNTTIIGESIVSGSFRNSYIRNSNIDVGCTIHNSTIENSSLSFNNNILNSTLNDVKIGNNNSLVNSCLEKCSIGDSNKIGPFSNIRPKTNIKDKVRIGNFVEVKNSKIGCSSKISHLSYVGDSIIENYVNMGCGSIIVNYDGVNKYGSTIKNGAFVGCNSNIISPVTIGENSYIAAGSTITNDVPNNSLSIARVRQVNKENWKHNNKKDKKSEE